MNILYKNFLYASLLVLFSLGCAPKQHLQIRSETPGESKLAWYAFVSRATVAETSSSPFRLSASLRYSEPDKMSTRVSSLLWGNGDSINPYPLRLDLLAGIGTVVAKVREDKNTFLAYSPDEKTAYTHSGNNQTLVSFGVPIPLTLNDLTLMLTGRSGLLFLPSGTTTESPMPQVVGITPNGIQFLITNAPLSGVLELAKNGSPLSWSEHKKDGWTIIFENEESKPLQPKKLRIHHGKGYQALIVVKGIEHIKKLYTKSQLQLELPAGTQKKQIEDTNNS